MLFSLLTPIVHNPLNIFHYPFCSDNGTTGSHVIWCVKKQRVIEHISFRIGMKGKQQEPERIEDHTENNIRSFTYVITEEVELRRTFITAIFNCIVCSVLCKVITEHTYAQALPVALTHGKRLACRMECGAVGAV